MCDPVSLGIAATAMSGLATGVSAYSAREQGKYQAAVAEQNAEAPERSAADARIQATAEGEQQRNRYKGIIGRQATATAASGIDVQSGTALDLFTETATLGEFDAQVTASNVRRQAYGLESQAVGQRQQGRLARASGRNRAFSTLLTGGARTASMGSQLMA